MHYVITVPVQLKDGVKHYRRVGVMFQNHRRETGEVFYALKLDFPVGATELVAFPPKSPEAASDPDPAGGVADKGEGR